MIIDDIVNIEIKRANVRFYKSKYNCKVSDIININVDDLPNGSNIIISVRCDVCGFDKKLSYRKYIKNLKNQEYYSCSSKCSTNKKKQTYIKKYGVDNPNKCDIIREKTKKTCLMKYGVDNPNKCDIIREKTKKTCLIKYNNHTYLNSDIYKSNMMELFGETNPMKSNYINQKRIKNSLKIDDFNYLKYQGKYELDFLVFCKNNNIFVEKPNFSIEYKYLSEFKTYFPDFYIPILNMVVEVKSSYYLNLHRDINEEKFKSVINTGYNFILILDKNYKELEYISKKVESELKNN